MSTLALGQAFGRVPQRWSAEAISLSPVIHDCSRVNVEHAHQAAFVTMMLEGEYSEKAGLRSIRFERFTTLLHPAGIEHQDSIGRPGVKLLMFEFGAELLEPQRRLALRDLSGSRIAFDLLSLYRSAARIDPLDFECRALALVENIDPFIGNASDLPSASRAREYVHANFRSRLTMAELARVISVHPVYLGQIFRRQYGETVGQYANRLRVRSAAEELSRSDASLASIAFDQGFCDQSHFQRVFRKFSGYTPAEFREAFR